MYLSGGEIIRWGGRNGKDPKLSPKSLGQTGNRMTLTTLEQKNSTLESLKILFF